MIHVCGHGVCFSFASTLLVCISRVNPVLLYYLIRSCMLIFRRSVKCCLTVSSTRSTLYTTPHHHVKPQPWHVKSLVWAGSSTTHTTTSSPKHLRSLCTNINIHTPCRVKTYYQCRVNHSTYRVSAMSHGHAASRPRHDRVKIATPGAPAPPT
ncbi:uncharacterized protein HD556DRAFT_626215 [Suillus plorans]|uniref:Uncharacterized protein n=1 Tax=Suillus plorans TaxID=116603 RepID=A0A9P7ALK9_9AGAM|nr:uncharacterized protein HD556DRAFT_626215 [Suillus plorans]KAG1791868.1 hypothetical protein HD556DRAFT_626215 [Suillus plorans]